MPLLGVNIDHVATVRQARRTFEPDPVWAAAACELGGADGITIHLREDRRHIQDRDVRVLRDTVTASLNLELACCDEIVALACETRPDQATLVPERREEVTTEGGLDAVGSAKSLAPVVERLRDAGILVSLFLDPDEAQIDAAKKMGADAVELHTGQYGLASRAKRRARWEELAAAGRQIRERDMLLHAGHGLTYHNVRPIAAIPEMRELNIGHSIVARALLVGLQAAVAEMVRLTAAASDWAFDLDGS